MGRHRWILPLIALCLAGSALAHDEDGGEIQHHENMFSNSTMTAPPNFFRHPHHTGWIYAHISTTIAAWVLVLPISVVLSIAKSPYAYRLHHLFHVLNIAGVTTGQIYKCLTPALYYHHVHGTFGWIVTAISIVWTLLWMSLSLGLRTGRTRLNNSNDSRLNRILLLPRWLRQDLNNERKASPSMKFDENCDVSDGDFERQSLLDERNDDHDQIKRKTHIHSFATLVATLLERMILLLGFAACVSGFVIYSGNFRGIEVFGGLSHWIKGGIFFWLGLLSLGRWIGAFADFGWAWNLKRSYKYHPSLRWKEKIPSLEFLESFLIWSYGASNVFLEHLSNWGGEWSATDFEHISITILFFGGGFLGNNMRNHQ